MALTHNDTSINKFGLKEDYSDDEEYLNEDSKIISPYYSHETNLDDLENVSGFSVKGRRGQKYAFKLNKDGIYERVQISIPTLFHKVKPHISMTVYMDNNNKFKLMKQTHNFLIDIQIKNDTVVYDALTNKLLRIHNLGSMLGNYVPLEAYKDSFVITKFKDKYYLAAESKTLDKTGIEFISKFKEDKDLLKNPPVNSTMIISGIILKDKTANDKIVEGIDIKIANIIKPTPFIIQIRKNKDDYAIKHHPEKEITLTINGDVNLDKMLIFKDVYMISHIMFTTDEITNQELSIRFFH